MKVNLGIIKKNDVQKNDKIIIIFEIWSIANTYTWNINFVCY